MGPNGYADITPSQAVTTYTITATNSIGTATAGVTVEWCNRPTVSISANPPAIASGGSTTITWSATGEVTTCSVQPGGYTALSGSAPVTLTQPATYTITATGPGGTSSGIVTVYILKPGAVTIISPIPGQTINRPDTLVRGTINNSQLTGIDVGVTVNGVVAQVYGNQFAANHVPLISGDNTITVTAISADDYLSTNQVTVNAVTSGNYITLTSNLESGLSPLDFTLSLEKTYSSTDYSFSYDPAGDIDNLGDDGEHMEFKRRITEPGLYFVTVNDVETLTDGTTAPHTDTIAVMAEDMSQFDAKLSAKWNGIRSTLTGYDINGSAKYFDSCTKIIYRDIFAGMPDQLSQMAQDMGDIQLIQAENDRAEYDLRIVRNGMIFSYFVLFVKDENGLWKIKSF